MRTEEMERGWRGWRCAAVGWEERIGGSGLAHPERSHGGKTEILILLLGFLIFPIKYSLLRVFVWDSFG